ncbi:MAG: hypothetical protein JNM86_10435 [Phycisphaerae bacterium]|nr:hypothetical protein [Phycisphaerae bacterium]MBN8599026.1 hypothetical protein [Planctomycetota bacterium]
MFTQMSTDPLREHAAGTETEPLHKPARRARALAGVAEAGNKAAQIETEIKRLMVEVGSRRPSKRTPRPALDRRRREALSREFGTRVTEHSRWLPKADLALVNWVYRAKRPLSELEATGVGSRWVLQRRLNRIVARVLSPAYRHVASLLAMKPDAPEWPPALPLADQAGEALAIARGIFIHGATTREVCAATGCTRWRVTRVREAFEQRAQALAS